jgi:hypothetical protein
MREKEGDRQRERKKCCLCSFLSRGYVERERERERQAERQTDGETSRPAGRQTYRQRDK